MNGFLQRLRQRKLVQWALAYVAFAFALLQGIDIVATRFGWPALVEKFLILALCVGFVLTLILAWYHGEQGRQRVSGIELIILAVVLAVGGGFLWQFTRVPRTAASTHAASAPVPSPTSKQAAVAAAATSIPPHSIAVLPFENLSTDKNSGYFADGVAEQLLDILAQSTRLKVAARTSAFQFRDRAESAQKIGAVLRVRYLLEGSLRKDGNQVRITAQLVDTRSGYQKWSDTYQRKLTDIFKVQDEISRAIAKALEVKLGVAGGEMAVARADPTTNVAAYDQYLLGRHLLNQRTSASLKRALVHFKKAVALDPDYAPANAQIAIVYTLLTKGNYGNFGYHDAVELARPYVNRAIAVAPDAPETQAAQGRVVVTEGSIGEGLPYFSKAVAGNPSYMDAVVWKAQILQTLGRFHDAIATLKAGVSLDPLNYIVNENYVDSLIARQRFDDARAVAKRFTQLDRAKGYTMSGMIAESESHPGEALQYYLKAAKESGADISAREYIIQILDEAGLFEDARRLRSWKDGGIGAALAGDTSAVRSIRRMLRSKLGDAPAPHVAAATIALILGNRREALRQFDRARQLFTLNEVHFPVDLQLGEIEYAALLREAGRLPESRVLLDSARRRIRMLASGARADQVSDPDILWSQASMEIMDGHRDAGLAELASATREPGYFSAGFKWPAGPLYLQRAPQFDAVRDDPRFKAIVREARQRQQAVRKAVLPVLCGWTYPLGGWRPSPTTCPPAASGSSTHG